MSKATLLDIGQALRRSRQARGLTASELALRAGISRNTIGALEAGRGNVELNTLLALLACLDLDLQFVPRAVADLTRVDADTKATGLQDEVRILMQSRRKS